MTSSPSSSTPPPTPSSSPSIPTSPLSSPPASLTPEPLSLDLLLDKQVSDLTDDDLNFLITRLRQERVAFLAAEAQGKRPPSAAKAAKAPAAKALAATANLSADASIADLLKGL